MSKSPYLLLLVAITLVVALAGIWSRSAGRTATDLLVSAAAHVAADPPDYQSALIEYGRALELAERSDDQDLVREVLRERSRLLQKQRSYQAAEADLLRIIQELDVDDTGSLLSLARIAYLRGDYDAALLRTGSMLDRSAATGPLLLRADVLVARAGDRLVEAADLFEDLLDDTRTKTARELAGQVAALDATDPLHVAKLHEFAELFGGDAPRDVQSASALVLAAGEDLSAARTAYAGSLKRGVTRAGAFGFLDLLYRSGRMSDTVDFGLAVRDLDTTRNDSRISQLLARALDALGRPDAAAIVIEAGLDPAAASLLTFLPEWCDILHAAERWNELLVKAQRLASASPVSTQGSRYRSTGHLYSGIALHALGRREEALKSLDRYLQADNPIQAFPGALSHAHRLRADCALALGLSVVARGSLRAAVALAPDASGEAWLQLSELLFEGTGPRYEAELAATNALCLLPERMEEILPLWIEVGEAALLEAERDPVVIQAGLRDRGRWMPSRAAGPYELYRLAQIHQEKDLLLGVLVCCRDLLGDHPGLLPALDLLLSATVTLGREDEAIELLLERLELAGVGDGKAVEYLRRLPPGTLTGSQTLRLMEHDPDHTGLLVLSAGLLARGRADEAFRGLTSRGLENLTPSARVLAGEILISMERWPAALAVLKEVKPSAIEYVSALRLRVRAAAGLGHYTGFEALLDEVIAVGAVASDLVIPVAEELLMGGQPGAAREVLGQLDKAGRHMDGAVLLRLAVAHLALGDVSGAHDALQRARAFSEDGASERGRVIVASAAGEWADLPTRVRNLRRTGWEPAQLEAALLAALEEQHDEARALAQEALAEDPDDPSWALLWVALSVLSGEQDVVLDGYGPGVMAETRRFLRGAPGGARDPRRPLAWILALSDPAFCLWALGELREDAGADGGLWARFLEAEALLVLGDEDAARLVFEELTLAWPLFPPAWAGLEALEEARLVALDHPDLLALRDRRRAALGPREGEEAEALLALADQLQARGAYGQAIERLEEALVIDGGFLPARVALAHAYEEQGDFVRSIAAFGAYFSVADPSDMAVYVQEYLELLEEGLSDGKLTSTVVGAELELLATVLPEDPTVVLALARRDLDVPQGTGIGVARAYTRLDEFRKETGGRPLQELRAGSALAWFEFHLSIDPDQAARFVAEELERTPDDLDLWIAQGDALRARGELASAAEHYEIILRMLPAAEAQRHLAELLADFGTDHGRVEELLQSAQAIEQASTGDRNTAFVRARSLINSGHLTLDLGIEVLGNLHERAAPGDADPSSHEVSRALGAALLRRGEEGDGARAAEVLRPEVERAADDATRDLLEALANVGSQL